MVDYTERPGHDSALDYHARLVADPHRVAAYERALRRTITPDSVVLDLGTGTGLLAVMAARLGARRVHAVESMGVAAAAQELAMANGVADRVIVHRADIRTLEVPERVDIVVSDFMGRFLVDDEMMEAMDVVLDSWLKPDGVVIPRRIELQVAPVELHHFAPLDTWLRPVMGIDLSSVRRRALDYCYGAMLSPHFLLAPAESLAVLSLGPHCRVDSGALDAELKWELQRNGHLRGLAGWFTAELCDGVSLTTAPGHETHWAQFLFGIERLSALSGDLVEAHVRYGGNNQWLWDASVTREGAVIQTGQHRGQSGKAFEETSESVVADPPDLERAIALNREGAEAFERDDLDAAVSLFTEASFALPPAESAGLAEDIYENLGTALALSHRSEPAVMALLRALDGDFSSREQSARLLVNACFQSGRHLDGARYLQEYEATYGPHPSQWEPQDDDDI